MRRAILLLALFIMGCSEPTPSDLDQFTIGPGLLIKPTAQEPLILVDTIELNGNERKVIQAGFFNIGHETAESTVFNISNCHDQFGASICESEFCESLPLVVSSIKTVESWKGYSYHIGITNRIMKPGNYDCDFVVEKEGNHSMIYESKNVNLTISEVEE